MLLYESIANTNDIANDMNTMSNNFKIVLPISSNDFPSVSSFAVSFKTLEMLGTTKSFPVLFKTSHIISIVAIPNAKKRILILDEEVFIRCCPIE